jgi:hypothetical protein
MSLTISLESSTGNTSGWNGGNSWRSYGLKTERNSALSPSVVEEKAPPKFETWPHSLPFEMLTAWLGSGAPTKKSLNQSQRELRGGALWKTMPLMTNGAPSTA